MGADRERGTERGWRDVSHQTPLSRNWQDEMKAAVQTDKIHTTQSKLDSSHVLPAFQHAE